MKLIYYLNYTIYCTLLPYGWVLKQFSKSFSEQLLNLNASIAATSLKNQTPNNLTNFVLYVEDRRFHFHLGVDLIAIIRALCFTLFLRKLQGASTISQQLVRTITKQKKISLKRKLREAVLACIISKNFTKAEILNAYFDLYEFDGCFGLRKLCKQEKLNIDQLTNIECIQIATRFKFPILRGSNINRYLKRVRTIENNYAQQWL